MISIDHFIKKTGADPGNSVRHWPSLVTSMEKYEINTPKRIAIFLANVVHETGGLRQLVENMNYTADRLMAVWPGRFDREKAVQFERKPDHIANFVYAGRMGNEQPDDGFKFRGRGMFMITGRQAYHLASWVHQIDFIDNPDLVCEPPYAALTAAYYFHLNRLNLAADREQLRAIRVAINGGLHGFEEVKKLYQKLLIE